MKAAFLLLAAGGFLFAQEVRQSVPVFRVTVVSRTTKAINYHHRSGSTKVDFRGTELMPAARGEAKVESQMGSTKIDTKFDRLSPANQFGPEYLTYVLWAITPEGRPKNLGEVVLQGDNARLLATTDLQAFGLIVTAEPYFAVTQPSDLVVMENFIRNDTTGTIQQVDAKYELLQRGQYVLNRGAYVPVKINPKGPLQLAEAENAVAIARLAGAERYAADTLQKALVALRNAQDYMRGGKGNSKPIETTAREAAQMAEDARIITIRKIQAEERAREQADAAAAKASAEQAEMQRRAEAARAAEAARQAEAAEAAALRARQEQAAAEAAKAQAESARAAAMAERQRAQAEADRARMAAQQADQQRQQAEREKVEMRQRLEQQLSMILETRESARGLIVNISDVLFDFNKYTLKPGAREKMAKVSGILLAYPGLQLKLEGHTDSIGSDEYNLVLSQKRADAVRDYLVSQGVPAAHVSAIGLGKADPVASNDSDAGRQQNRRVEMIVAGDIIGIPVAPITTPQR
jgi:outer membrane protein OmpA-like peptidoglycan-associated protein